jgi:ABC-type multidrug transport system fused ATPase/permease subunit
MKTIKKFLALLSTRERKHLILLMILILIMALLDTIGIASVLPFMTVLANPDSIQTNLILNKTYQVTRIFGVENNQDFIIFFGVLIFIFLVTSLAFKTFVTYAQIRFVYLLEHTIGKKLIEGYLHQPYSWFLSRNSADIGKTVLSEVQKLVEIGIYPMMELISKGVVALVIVTLLFLVDAKLALITGSILGGTYWIIFHFIKKFANRIGIMRLENNHLRFKWIGEAFGAIKQVKIGGLEKFYIKYFSDYTKNYAQSIASSQLVFHLPRFILEAIAFGGVMLIILYLMIQTGTFTNVLPVVSLYVFAAYRLMPALQQIYSSLTQITFVGPSLDKICEDIKNLKPFNLSQAHYILPFKNKITLKDINFNYPNASRATLKNINLSISAKSTVGFVGSTGSGKTTMIDIILGLLEPLKGSLEIDGKVITKKNLRAWQSCIGYVPQDIYLADDTVASNIAFGANYDDVNQQAVEKASKIANLHDFIMRDLPHQYKTVVGERGIRLSGGQRQRIGIARALYHNPQILILDEATSALDNQTEKVVMDAVNNLNKNITIIIIAHRLTTVKNCDIIFLLDNGELKDKGTFEELMKVNDQFKKNATYL